MKRLIAPILSGLLISLGLFWLMQSMVMNNQQQLQKTENLKMVEFVRLKRESKLQTKERKIPEKPPEKRPPPPKMQTQQVQVSQDVPDMEVPNLDIPIQTNRFNGTLLSGLKMGAGSVSTNVIPLVRIPPRYPMRAANRRIEGWVKVEFTITETGTVKDAKVVEAQPENIFNRAALQAIRKWKFKEKIIDGQAIEQRAIQVLQFKLSR